MLTLYRHWSCAVRLLVGTQDCDSGTQCVMHFSRCTKESRISFTCLFCTQTSRQYCGSEKIPNHFDRSQFIEFFLDSWYSYLHHAIDRPSSRNSLMLAYQQTGKLKLSKSLQCADIAAIIPTRCWFMKRYCQILFFLTAQTLFLSQLNSAQERYVLKYTNMFIKYKSIFKRYLWL